MFTTGRFLLTGVLLPFFSGMFCFWVGYGAIRLSQFTYWPQVEPRLVVAGSTSGSAGGTRG